MFHSNSGCVKKNSGGSGFGFEPVSLTSPTQDIVFTYKNGRVGKTEKARQILDNTQDYLSYLRLVHTAEDCLTDEEEEAEIKQDADDGGGDKGDTDGDDDDAGLS